MADPRDDLTAIVDEVRRVTTLPGAQALRHRSDRRRRRRAAVGAVGLAVVALAAGTAVVQVRDTVETPGGGPASQAAPPVVPSATASAGPQEILGGRRQVQIVLPGMRGAALAIDSDGDQVRATTEQGIDDRALWVLRPEGDRYRILLASGADAICLTVVHDAAPGSVRGRACDAAASTQLFRIDQVPDGSYSIFQGKRYVQVVDGTNALVPDLPEGLTTTYEFLDRGPR
ncbi:RICIN domain-containing protein [Micromonospora sp. MED01]|uniref:RICIN domain-containing protein n=1 Tax=Micromonospora alfalfae TaxID=2911212 RepID=UPI001EE7A36A|nr:RICIN domain-containing protein [Micromonospora alfalfae]MCG5462830.1 RICIN domain-containing protein [Micromonospora alfalfae]